MVSGELKLQLYRAFAGISSRILNPQTIHHKTVGPKLSWNWTRYRAQPGLWELQESSLPASAHMACRVGGVMLDAFGHRGSGFDALLF